MRLKIVHKSSPQPTSPSLKAKDLQTVFLLKKRYGTEQLSFCVGVGLFSGPEKTRYDFLCESKTSLRTLLILVK